MKKRSRILLLSLLLSGSGLQAQNLVPCVVVEQTDGTLSEYLLASAPHITYAADVVTLTATDATLQLPVAEVKKVYLSETGNQSEGIASRQTSTPRVQLTADGLRLSGLAAGSPVMVYAADGRLLLSQKAAADGTLSLSLSHLSQGMLIVKTNNQSFKFTRK